MNSKMSAYESATANDVIAYALLFDGKPCGKMFGVCPGSTWKVTLSAWDGPLKDKDAPYDAPHTATAGGGGYDKVGSCIEQILQARGFEAKGSSTHAITDIEALGYEVFRIV